MPDRMTLGPPLPRRADPEGSKKPHHELRKSRALGTKKSAAGPVIVGVIDDGIAFGHERFRKSGGTTRVEFVWIQDGAVWVLGFSSTVARSARLPSTAGLRLQPTRTTFIASPASETLRCHSAAGSLRAPLTALT